jgi:hypothetical protein
VGRENRHTRNVPRCPCSNARAGGLLDARTFSRLFTTYGRVRAIGRPGSHPYVMRRLLHRCQHTSRSKHYYLNERVVPLEGSAHLHLGPVRVRYRDHLGRATTPDQFSLNSPPRAVGTAEDVGVLQVVVREDCGPAPTATTDTRGKRRCLLKHLP